MLVAGHEQLVKMQQAKPSSNRDLSCSVSLPCSKHMLIQNLQTGQVFQILKTSQITARKVNSKILYH